MKNPEFYQELSELRSDDVFPDHTFANMLLDNVFPKSSTELAQKLSNVTSAFYGLTLKQIAEHCGKENIDPVSRSLFKELGMLKTQEAMNMQLSIPSDTRALALVLISAIYTSSPEYKFEVKTFKPNITDLRLFGVCRYYRIAKKLNIERYITWPNLVPFFEGVAEQMQINCTIEMKVISLEDDGRCDYYLRCSM
jgi:hypothetical protein